MSMHQKIGLPIGVGGLQVETENLHFEYERIFDSGTNLTPSSAHHEERTASIASLPWSTAGETYQSPFQQQGSESVQSYLISTGPQDYSPVEGYTSTDSYDDSTAVDKTFQLGSGHNQGFISHVNSQGDSQVATDMHGNHGWMDMSKTSDVPFNGTSPYDGGEIANVYRSISSAPMSIPLALAPTQHAFDPSRWDPMSKPWTIRRSSSVGAVELHEQCPSSKSWSDQPEYKQVFPMGRIVPSSTECGYPSLNTLDPSWSPIFREDHRSESEDNDAISAESPSSEVHLLGHQNDTVYQLEKYEMKRREAKQTPPKKLRKVSYASLADTNTVRKRTGSSSWSKRNGISKINVRESAVYDTKLNGSEVEVDWQATATKGKMQICQELFPNGSQCGKAFERVEHLKRHQKTHRSLRSIRCPLDVNVFKCEKSFSDRRDNWRDHLKTHLKVSAASRNNRCTPEQMYEALRKHEDAAEAEKTIGMLEQWVAKGGPLVNSCPSFRQQPSG